jgi:hypothetical protein
VLTTGEGHAFAVLLSCPQLSRLDNTPSSLVSPLAGGTSTGCAESWLGDRPERGSNNLDITVRLAARYQHRTRTARRRSGPADCAGRYSTGPPNWSSHRAERLDDRFDTCRIPKGKVLGELHCQSCTSHHGCECGTLRSRPVRGPSPDPRTGTTTDSSQVRRSSREPFMQWSTTGRTLAKVHSFGFPGVHASPRTWRVIRSTSAASPLTSLAAS